MVNQHEPRLSSGKVQASILSSVHGRIGTDESVAFDHEYLRRNHRSKSWPAERLEPKGPEARECLSRLSTTFHGGHPVHGWPRCCQMCAFGHHNDHRDVTYDLLYNRWVSG